MTNVLPDKPPGHRGSVPSTKNVKQNEQIQTNKPKGFWGWVWAILSFNTPSI